MKRAEKRKKHRAVRSAPSEQCDNVSDRVVFANGDIQEGEWKNGILNGSGKYIWADGGQWIGEFNNGLPWNGNGICYIDGKRFEGEIKDGKKVLDVFGLKFKYK